MRVLLIEDDPQTARHVTTTLTSRGHEVRSAVDLASARTMFEPAPDILIVDRMLPDGDGIELVAELRASREAVPVLFLTARGLVEDRVAGFEAGGDDYLLKPFAAAELTARAEALARRALRGPATFLTIADLNLDRLARTVERGGQAIVLQPREFELLEMLMLHSPNPVTRMMLLEKVWKFRFDPATNLIESHVSRLRGKIDYPGTAPLIHTIRNQGYAVHSG